MIFTPSKMQIRSDFQQAEQVLSPFPNVFLILIFLFFPFDITMTMFLKYSLRHKVDLHSQLLHF